jgi:hypothetical protein
LLLPPQEEKFKMAHNPTTSTRIRFFKRQAPKDMKKGDLIAKWWIIADPELALIRSWD